MSRVLIVVAESLSPQRLAAIAEGREPRIDMLELARAIGAELLTLDSLCERSAARRELVGERPARPRFDAAARPKPGVANAARLAAAAHAIADDFELILCSGEDVAIPLAAWLRWQPRRARLATIGHVLSPWKKRILLGHAGLAQQLDHLILYSPVQARVAMESLGVAGGRISLIPFHADARFYNPGPEAREPDLIVAAGSERRDYATLFEAVSGEDVRLELGVGSPWSRFRRTLPPLPPRAENRFRSREELRELFRRAGCVVVPLVENDFQAGISILLEAQACGAPVVVTGTRGLRPLLNPAELRIVPPGDPVALRTAIRELRADPAAAREMGLRGAARVHAEASTDAFIARIAEICERIAAPALRAG